MPNYDTTPLQTAVKAKAQLCSIFDRITSDGGSPPKKRNALNASTLTAQNIVTSAGSLSPESLGKDLAQLAALHSDAQEATYFYLLQKYGWRIGQPDMDEDEPQDEAFCDAERVRLALAAKQESGSGYLLVKGDLSGIQEYIYGGIQQKTAGGLAKLSKRLRGRSILVTLLTDFLANVALRELGLPVWNLLFAGGGHFNLLLPDTPEMRKNLEDLDKKLDSEMRGAFGDRLQLIMASVPCSEDDITNKSGRCFERLNAEREGKKYRQHHKYLHDHFYPPESKTDKDEKDNKEISVGERFPKLNVLMEAVCDGPVFSKGKLPELLTLEMHKHTYSLLAVEDIASAKRMLLDNATGLVSAQVFALNDTEFLPKKEDWSKVAIPVSFGFRFLGKYVPTARYIHPKSGDIETRPQTFEEITRLLPDGAMDTDAEKIPLEMLGSIRLDVDDLGYIFSRGMKDATLAQIVTLSREMHYFFSAHFDELAKKEEHQLYLIYSGGDDAFAVGQWNSLIAFSRNLQTDFQRFVFGNPAVHFSAGIFLGDPKYPVGRFYLDTGALLEDAKKSNYDKNRIHIFHQITQWEAFEKKIKFGAGLSKMLDKNDPSETRKLSMAFAYRLLTLSKTSFYERADMVNGTLVKRGWLNHRRFAHNIGRMRYLFARHGYDEKKAAEVTNKVEIELITDFFRNFKFGGDTTEQSIRDNLVALNYALYTIRSQKNTHSQHG